MIICISVKEPNDDWGNEMVDNADASLNVSWRGVMGGVITGQYDMSLSAWLYQEKRSKVLSFSTFVTGERFLVATPNVLSIDFGLLLRPLTTSAWQGIVGVLLLSSLAGLVIKPGHYDEIKLYERILVISTWIFFVLLNSFYGGAMTMFFANDITLPFHNIGEVIRAYPEWNLLVFRGTEPTYMLYAEQGDPDYKAIMNRVGSDPESSIYHTMEEGMMRLRDGRTVLHTTKERLNSFINENPQVLTTQKLFIFGKEKLSDTTGFTFTLNSPLRPLFDRAITKLKEGGAYDFLRKRW